MPTHKDTDPYSVISQFYDELMGSRKDDTQALLRNIKKHHPRCRSVLELACGTGEILLPLSKQYSVSGLDISKKMLDQAREKLPNKTPLFLGEMSQFKIDEKFDAIICVFDSINHLLKWSEWKSLFKCVNTHLKLGGVFYFDFHSIEELVRHAKSPTWVKSGSFGTALIKVTINKQNITNWNLKVFEQTKTPHLFQLHETNIAERSFRWPKVKEELEQYFEKAELLLPALDGSKPKSISKFFILCRKAT